MLEAFGQKAQSLSAGLSHIDGVNEKEEEYGTGWNRDGQ